MSFVPPVVNTPNMDKQFVFSTTYSAWNKLGKHYYTPCMTVTPESKGWIRAVAPIANFSKKALIAVACVICTIATAIFCILKLPLSLCCCKSLKKQNQKQDPQLQQATNSLPDVKNIQIQNQKQDPQLQQATDSLPDVKNIQIQNQKQETDQLPVSDFQVVRSEVSDYIDTKQAKGKFTVNIANKDEILDHTKVISPQNEKKENLVEKPEIILLDSKSKIDQTLITFPFLRISRLGDYAKFYLNAKWAAYQLGVPVVIRSFPDSDKLKISENHKYHLANSAKENNFTKLSIQQMQDISDGKLTKEDLGPGIFTVPFFWEWRPSPTTAPSWIKNTQFRTSYCSDFYPASNLQTDLVLPIESKINIAIQVRDGGEFDNLHDKFLYPARFPDLSYYDAQLEYVLKLPEHQGQSIHIQIFTDATDPSKMKERFEKIAQKCDAKNVSIAFRPNNCSADEAIVNDLISLTKFSIVIRAKSGFSDLSVFLGLPKLEIHPHHSGLTAEGVAFIDKVNVIRRNPDDRSTDIMTGSSIVIEGATFSKKWPAKQMNEFKKVWAAYTKKN